jgi:UDP-glucose 4-epimerase
MKATFPVTIIRLPGIFGSAKNDRSVIGSLIRAISSKSELHLTSTGLEKRDYVYIADLCNLIVQLIDVRHNGILNIATGVSNSIIEIVNEIKCALGSDCELKISESGGDRSFDLVFNNTKIKQLLPFFNFSTLRDGIMSYKE